MRGEYAPQAKHLKTVLDDCLSGFGGITIVPIRLSDVLSEFPMFIGPIYVHGDPAH